MTMRSCPFSTLRRVPATARSRPRRVLLLTYHLSPSGMEQQLIHLARGLAARGDEVTVGCFDPWHPPSAEQVTSGGVRLLRFPDGSRLGRLTRGAGAVARLARRHDVVHCTGWDASLWGRIGAALGGRRAVVTDHTADRSITKARDGQERAALVAWHNRVLDPVTSALVAVAESQMALLASEGVRRSHLHMIPNGVPLDAIRAVAARPADRAALGLPEGARVVVQVGRLIDVKRPEWTYEAVAALRARTGEDVHALWVGGGPLENALAERVRAEGAHWAHLAGRRTDVPALLALADLAVLPSSAEALPLAMIEALAVGVPQVATDVGDVGRTLRRTGAGLAVAADDHAAFTDACARVLGDAGLAARLGAAARAAAQEFDASVMIDRYSALFDAVAAGRG